jgi:SAM-dependent methyltransferase
MSGGAGADEGALERAFDGQAAAFERAPIQTDPGLLAALVAFADFPPGARVLDAGCGPGLVAEALLAAPGGHRVLGCDLSGEMVERARARCARFGERAELVRASVRECADDLMAGRRAPVGGSISRFVLHHAPDPRAFVAAQVQALAAGGADGAVLVLADHLADAEPELAAWHRRLETMRDRTHTTNLSGGALIDLLADAGLTDLRYEEHPLGTDFEEWFARGTPSVTRQESREWLLEPRGRRSRAWRPTPMPDGNVWIDGLIGYARGVLR